MIEYVWDAIPLIYAIGIGLLPRIMAYILLMKAANIEWERLNYANVLMYIGLFNMIFQCVIFFIPEISGTDITQDEQGIIIGYILGVSLVSTIVPILIFGLPLILIGIKNRVKYDADYLIVAGFLYILYKGLAFVAFAIIKVQTLFYNLPIIYLAAMILGSIIVALFAFLSIIQFGIKMENRPFLISGMLLICGAIGAIPYGFDLVTDIFIWILLIIYITALHQVIIKKYGDQLTDLELTLAETKRKITELTKESSEPKSPPKRTPAKRTPVKKALSEELAMDEEPASGENTIPDEEIE